MSEELLRFFLEGVTSAEIEGVTFCRKPANMDYEEHPEIQGTTGAFVAPDGFLFLFCHLRFEFKNVKTCADGSYADRRSDREKNENVGDRGSAVIERLRMSHL